MPVTLCQSHTPGERLFIDYSGQAVVVVDPATGEERVAQIFVAVFGASNYTFVEATWSQGLADWVGSHVRCLEFLGGVPELLVPDNLKSRVKSPSLYEPDLNPSYQELAVHYGVAVLPARVRKPRDNVFNGTNLKVRFAASLQQHERPHGERSRHADQQTTHVVVVLNPTALEVGKLNLALDDVGKDFSKQALGAVERTHRNLL